MLVLNEIGFNLFKLHEFYNLVSKNHNPTSSPILASRLILKFFALNVVGYSHINYIPVLRLRKYEYIYLNKKTNKPLIQNV
jgi:hypothetical protein